MTLNEIFAAKIPTNKIVWHKRKDGVEKKFVTAPRINSRTHIEVKDKDGR